MNYSKVTEPVAPTRKFANLFNIKSADYINNPYRYYAEVRETCPIYKTPYGIHVLTKYKDIQLALNSKLLVKKYWEPLINIYGQQCFQESGFSLIAEWIINKNPPKHTKIRRLLTTALSANKLHYLNHTTATIADRLIDKFYKEGQVDFVKDYAFKLPALVICHLLGIPESDYEFLFNTTSLPNVLLDPVYLPRTVLDNANESVDQLKAYFSELCDARQKNLGEDLISLLLIAKKNEGILLDDSEVISNIFFLFGAGHETTMNLISSGLYTLYNNPTELIKLKNNLLLLPQAIFEMLRYEAPVQVASPSVATEDVNIHGVVIPQGEVVMPILGAACRDPEEYPLPDQFLIERNHKNTLAFGYGIHLCLGAQLAKIEGKVAIERILKRLPNLQIMNLDYPQWKPVISVRSLKELWGKW